MRLILYLLFGVCVAAALVLERFFATPGYVPVSASICILFIWIIYYWRTQTGSFFDVFCMFFLAAVLFNGGHAFLHLFGYHPGPIWMYKYYNDSYCVYIFQLIFLALYFLGMGGITATLRLKPPSSGPDPAPQNPTVLIAFQHVGIFLCAIAIIPTLVYMAYLLNIVRVGGYFALYQQGQISPGMSAAANTSKLLLPGLLTMLIGYYRHVWVLKWLVAAIVAYSFIFFFLGSRSNAIMPLLAFAWVWHIWVRPISRILLLSAGAFFCLIIFPLVAMMRDTPSDQRADIADYTSVYLSTQNPFINILTEMGGSSITVAGTVELIPSHRQYGLGKSYLDAISAIFLPGRIIGWDDLSLSSWFIWAFEKETAEIGGGLGFSFIAEAYYNFGVAGLLFVPFIIGYLLAKVATSLLENHSPYMVLFAGMLLVFIPFFARGESLDVIPFLVRFVLVPMALIKLYRIFLPERG